MSARELFDLDNEADEHIYGSSEEDVKTKISKKKRVVTTHSDESDLEDESDTENYQDALEPEKPIKPLNQEEAKERLEAIKKSGVVYISRIPPFMKPAKLKHILSRFGQVNRIFLVPEDAKVKQRRVRAGGNRKKKFVEGWAEFKKKSEAKLAAETLNGNIIGGKKHSYYHDDILNIKYLKKFKWTDLTEAIALENQERQEKLKAEISQATKENRMFIENVERKAMFDNIERKNGQIKNPVHRTFNQRQVREKTSKAKQAKRDTAIDNVLSKIF